MAFQLYPRHNDALHANPPAGDVHITTHASDWLWAVFAIMILSWFTVVVWTYSSARHIRIFHYIPLIVLSVASVAYFSMASDLGWTLIRSEFGSHPTRQIWYVRYIQWFINAPLLLLALLSFSYLATPVILTVLFFAWFLVVNGLIGALVSSSYKWGYFVFGLCGLFFIWYFLLIHVPFVAKSFGQQGFKWGYLGCAGYLSFIWMLYPICWGLSEGSNTISPTSEMVFYGILDIMSAPVFLLVYIMFLSEFDDQELRTTAFGTAARGEGGTGQGSTTGQGAPGQKPGGPPEGQPGQQTADVGATQNA